MKQDNHLDPSSRDYTPRELALIKMLKEVAFFTMLRGNSIQKEEQPTNFFCPSMMSPPSQGTGLQTRKPE